MLINQRHILSRFSHLVDVLRCQAEQSPQQKVFSFLADGENESRSLTFAQLDQQARAIATTLQGYQVLGERVLIFDADGYNFIIAFIGCLYAGAIAVPVASAAQKRHLPRLRSIVQNAEAKFVLGGLQGVSWLKSYLDPDDQFRLTYLSLDMALETAGSGWRPPAIDDQSIAFLQYTSGSTAQPRGVKLTYRNLHGNLALIAQAFEIGPADVGLFWLPLHHDMGLIGGVLGTIVVEKPVAPDAMAYIMPPTAFVERPVRWLEGISRYRATISGAPNFAYDWCGDRITPEQSATLDLSCWETAFCGAEPIRFNTLRQFQERFASSGFRPEAFLPCYGLAESTLMVTRSQKSRPIFSLSINRLQLRQNRVHLLGKNDLQGQTLVSSGAVPAENELLIVDPETDRPCGDSQVGEIWLAAANRSVSQGYWREPVLTNETFAARIAGDASQRYLRTGDLGFLAQGELFVTGRIKNLIIINGQNFYAQDFENRAVQAHESLHPQGCAAFSVLGNEGQEKLAIIAEPYREKRGVAVGVVASAVSQAIEAQFGAVLHAFVLIRPGHLPRTTSGKTEHYRCRELFLTDRLNVLGQYRAESATGAKGADKAALNETGKRLLPLLAEMLDCEPETIDLSCSIRQLGLGSLHAIAIRYRIQDDLGVVVSPELFAADLSLSEFFAAVDEIDEAQTVDNL